MMNGGYLMVSKTDTKLYEKLNKALTLGKPVLWYEDENTCYYIDAITKSGTDIILTKGGKTITIENDGDITEVGNIQTLMEDIKDKDGNLRFVEGDIALETISGITQTYGKWSLSGTHLMLVLAIDITDTTINVDDVFANIELPDYIINKISPIYSVYIMNNTYNLLGHGTSDETLNVILRKENDKIAIRAAETKSLSGHIYSVRMQFDLLIDAK